VCKSPSQASDRSQLCCIHCNTMRYRFCKRQYSRASAKLRCEIKNLLTCIHFLYLHLCMRCISEPLAWYRQFSTHSKLFTGSGYASLPCLRQWSHDYDTCMLLLWITEHKGTLLWMLDLQAKAVSKCDLAWSLQTVRQLWIICWKIRHSNTPAH